MISIKFLLGGDSWRLIGGRASASLSESTWIVGRIWGIVFAESALGISSLVGLTNAANTIRKAGP